MQSIISVYYATKATFSLTNLNYIEACVHLESVSAKM